MECVFLVTVLNVVGGGSTIDDVVGAVLSGVGVGEDEDVLTGGGSEAVTGLPGVLLGGGMLLVDVGGV